jgi:hypothetical protein
MTIWGAINEGRLVAVPLLGRGFPLPWRWIRLGGTARGGGPLALDATGGGECGEGVVEALDGEVALAEVADWVRVSPSGERASAAWIFSASGSPLVPFSARAADRAA